MIPLDCSQEERLHRLCTLLELDLDAGLSMVRRNPLLLTLVSTTSWMCL